MFREKKVGKSVSKAADVSSFSSLRATPTQRSGRRSEEEARNHGDRKEVEELATEASDHRYGEEVKDLSPDRFWFSCEMFLLKL